MTKDFHFNTAWALDKAKANRDKPVTPVEYKPVISDAGADSNMLWPDTMHGLLPKGTGKITLLESNPSTWVMRITADRRIEVNEDVEVTEAAQKVLDAMRCLLAAQPAPVEPDWKWFEAPVKTQWGADMVVADLAIDKDHTASIYCERDQTAKVEAMLTPPAAQRQWVGLTDEEHTQIAIDSGCMSADWVFYGAAVERKVKEKNF